jgi:hypothetical protein
MIFRLLDRARMGLANTAERLAIAAASVLRRVIFIYAALSFPSLVEAERSRQNPPR